jgi:two-component system, chemotaxis family, chemotaxis protein CheY
MNIIKSRLQAPQVIGRPNSLRLLRKRRVLVADNDQATSSALSQFANGDHYEILALSDGAEAYRRLHSDADFQVAIISMTIPSIKGLDIVRYMKTENRLKRIPVIVIAEEPGLDGLDECFSAGAVALFPKPFAYAQLWRIVRSLSEQPQQRRRAA